MTATDSNRPGGGLLRAHLWLILMTTVAAVLAALAYVEVRETDYVATAEVVVNPEETTGTPLLPDMATERAVATSGAVAAAAARDLGISADTASDHLSVSVPTDTAVLRFSYTAVGPVAAVEGARAFAEAYVDYRNDLTKPEVAVVITPPELPTSPQGVNYPVLITLSLLLGAAVGVAAAFVWDKVSGRLRGAGDVEATLGVPVLAAIPHLRGTPEPGNSGVRSDRGSQALGYLTAKVVHAFRRHEGGASVLVTSAAPRAGTSFVAANLAAGLASVGRMVILVSSDVDRPESRPWFMSPGVGPWLEPEVPLDRALRSTEVEGLYVLTTRDRMDNRASTMEDLEIMLGQLSTRAEIVVFDGPPVLGSAESALLADRFDTVLLVADLDRGLRADAVATMQALGHVQGSIEGAVVNHPRGRWFRRLFRRSRRTAPSHEMRDGERQAQAVSDEAERIGR